MGGLYQYLSLIRAQNLHWDVAKLRQVLITCGEIPLKVFEESLDVPAEQLGASLGQGSHKGELIQAINEYAQTNELGVIPKRMKEGLSLIIRRAKWDTHNLGPIVGYLMARETEAEALRLIFGGLQGGFEVTLPEVYA